MLRAEKRRRAAEVAKRALDRELVTPEEMMEFLRKVLKRNERRKAKLAQRRSTDKKSPTARS